MSAYLSKIMPIPCAPYIKLIYQNLSRNAGRTRFSLQDTKPDQSALLEKQALVPSRKPQLILIPRLVPPVGNKCACTYTQGLMVRNFSIGQCQQRVLSVFSFAQFMLFSISQFQLICIYIRNRLCIHIHIQHSYLYRAKQKKLCIHIIFIYT